jgi:Fe(3+) dicitrate transport protein
MEDGILIAPSLYSAPAAYYFLNINRMAAVEAFRDPRLFNMAHIPLVERLI